MSTLPIRSTKIIGVVVAAVVGVGLWWGMAHNGMWNGNSAVRKKAGSPMVKCVKAYNDGKFKEAEAAALKIIEQNRNSKDPVKRRQAAQARYITAFAAARQQNMNVARDRFAKLQAEAANLPDKGKRDPLPGQAQPSLEEDGAYQHAVCTAALGDKKAAEAEYMKIMADYPESPLMTAAARRIEILHDGKMPAAAEAAWKRASKIALSRQQAREAERLKQASKCGPECLAEILRRHGKQLSVDALAKEMKTTSKGTSLLTMAAAAKKHGIPAKGYQLTAKGLKEQKTPIIALLHPGHYVIVESVSPTEVVTWDPQAGGLGKPGVRSYSSDEWNAMWKGIALVFGKAK